MFIRKNLLFGLSLLVVLAALGVSLYLSYTKLNETEVVCSNSGGFDCNLVQNSVYSEIFGIPLPYLGVFGNGLLLLLLIGEKVSPFVAQYSRTLILGLAFYAFLQSLYLSYIEEFVLEAWCEWCLTTALLMTAFFVLAIIRMLAWMREISALETA